MKNSDDRSQRVKNAEKQKSLVKDRQLDHQSERFAELIRKAIRKQQDLVNGYRHQNQPVPGVEGVFEVAGQVYRLTSNKQ